MTLLTSENHPTVLPREVRGFWFHLKPVYIMFAYYAHAQREDINVSKQDTSLPLSTQIQLQRIYQTRSACFAFLGQENSYFKTEIPITQRWRLPKTKGSGTAGILQVKKPGICSCPNLRVSGVK